MVRYLYVHIPFCVRKCIYCDFISVPFGKDLSRLYVDALKREISMAGGGELETLYIGGGTPTSLPVEDLGEIFMALKERFHFAEGAEVTVEANPGTVDLEKIEAFISLGLNRLSLGVQSLNDTELSTLGRLHSADEARGALRAARSAGVRNVSIDLIYGIPGQRLSDWKDTLSEALGLGAEHVSAYELTLEPGTRLQDMVKEGALKMPDEGPVLEMFNHAIDGLTASGYRHYEVSNYARHGYECRHNLNYWDRGEYAGLGAGAHSFLGGKRYKNTGDVGRYIELLSRGISPSEEAEPVSASDAFREFVFLGLRKTEGIKMGALADVFTAASRELVASGFMETEGDFLGLTRKGLFVSNSVIAEMLCNKLEASSLSLIN